MSKLRYVTARPEQYVAASGDRYVVEYAPKFDDQGNFELVEAGKKDMYDEIQSHALSCDIHYILARYANGETDLLSKRQGIYGDFSDFPKTYAEMFQKIEDGKNMFMQLPVEVRAKFEHNFEKWLSTYGSEDWFAKMSKESVSNVSSVGSVREVDAQDGESTLDE